MASIVQALEVGKQVTSPAGILTILEAVTVTVSAGERVAILGVSGSGKSTLLGLLAGLDLPSRGRVVLDEIDIGTLNEDARTRLRGRVAGFVFQDFQLLPSLTALENVMLPLELVPTRDIGAGDPRRRATQILERVGLADRAAHYPSQLSGGEQQRVALARAAVHRPKVLFADEPTGSLDTRTGQVIAELLFGLNRDLGTTLVLVTHDAELARRCDRSYELSAGTLAEIP